MKQFYSDVRGRIKEIADRYVLPPQTLDVAFMFVPAENVYYEVIGRPELLTYGRECHVVPVSPNTMYAYIQALAVGFRGMKIQEEAKRVQEMLAQLATRFDKFQDHFSMVGKHLDNAKSQFERAMRDVERFDATLQGVKIGRIEETQPQFAEIGRSSSMKPCCIWFITGTPSGPTSIRCGRCPIVAASRSTCSRRRRPSGERSPTSSGTAASCAPGRPPRPTGGAAIPSRHLRPRAGCSRPIPPAGSSMRSPARPAHHARRTLSASAAPAGEIANRHGRCDARGLSA